MQRGFNHAYFIGSSRRGGRFWHSPDLVTTPASAQCEPSFRNDPADGFWLNRLPPQARAEPLCLFDPVVWVNTKSRVYHVAGSRYMCETEAKFAGNRAAPR